MRINVPCVSLQMIWLVGSLQLLLALTSYVASCQDQRGLFASFNNARLVSIWCINNGGPGSTALQDRCLPWTRHPHVRTAACVSVLTHYRGSCLWIWKLSAALSRSIEGLWGAGPLLNSVCLRPAFSLTHGFGCSLFRVALGTPCKCCSATFNSSIYIFGVKEHPGVIHFNLIDRRRFQKQHSALILSDLHIWGSDRPD